MHPVRAIAVAAIISLTMALAATAALAATKKVGVRKAGDEFRFTPSSLTIRTGDTVRWSWKGKAPHNVKGPGFQSGTATNLTYSRRFPRAGSFRIVCTIHASAGQVMRVKVR
jgi:plastocyanin